MALNNKLIFTVTNDLSYDQRMQRICRSLCAGGYEVELVGRELSNSAQLAAEPFKQTRLKCFINKGKLFYVEYNLRLFLYLLFKKANAICAIDLDTVVPVFFAAKIKGAKLVYDAHEYFTEVPEVTNRTVVKKAWQWVERTFVPEFDLAYTVSPAIAELFSKLYGKQFYVILNAPVQSAPDSYRDRNAQFILYQGALNEGRGLEQAIEAMQHIDGKLVLAGEGDLSGELRKLVGKYSLQSKVEFAGYVNPRQLKVITVKAHIGLNLLKNKGLSYYYSLSNKFFDYIHAGVPQVCIDFPEYRKINDEYEVAVLIKECSAEEIKKAIDRLFTDKELYSRLQKNCEVCSTHINWQTEEKKLVALYNELLR